MSESADVNNVIARLLRLEDEAAITRVLYKYAHAIDYGDETGWADCFTDDAYWHGVNPGSGDEMEMRGRAELYDFATGHTRPPDFLHKHVMTAPIVDVDGDTARCVSYFQFICADALRVPMVISFGRYTDTFVRLPNGEWRIAERLAEPQGWNPIWTEMRNSRRRQLAAEAAAPEPHI